MLPRRCFLARVLAAVAVAGAFVGHALGVAAIPILAVYYPCLIFVIVPVFEST